MFRLIKILIIISIMIVSLLTAGCTHYSKVPDYSLRSQPADYIIANKIDLSVALFQSEEFRKAKWELHMAGDTFLLEIGPQLAKNSNELASILFKNVITTDAAMEKPNSRGRLTDTEGSSYRKDNEALNNNRSSGMETGRQGEQSYLD